MDCSRACIAVEDGAQQGNVKAMAPVTSPLVYSQWHFSGSFVHWLREKSEHKLPTEIGQTNKPSALSHVDSLVLLRSIHLLPPTVVGRVEGWESDARVQYIHSSNSRLTCLKISYKIHGSEHIALHRLQGRPACGFFLDITIGRMYIYIRPFIETLLPWQF